MNNKFTLTIKVTWVFFVACIIAVFFVFYQLLIENSTSGDWIYLLASIPLGIISGIFLVLLYSLRRAYDQQQNGIVDGVQLAHWLYDEEEWLMFSKLAWNKMKWRLIYCSLALIGVFLFIGSLDSRFRQDILPIAGPCVAGFIGSLCGILLFLNYSLYKRSMICTREVYIGSEGVCIGGFYNTWSGFGTKLGNVRFFKEGISLLEFEILMLSRYGANSNLLLVPVPRGHEKEAEEVIVKLSSKISSS